MPKVELHVHLDPSLTFRAVRQLRPGITRALFEQSYVGPERCTDLVDFLRYIDPSLELMQTVNGLRLATEELVRALAADGVVYVEIRYAPLLHLRQGLTAEIVVETVVDAFNRASARHRLRGGILLCTLRHFTAKQSLETARLAHLYQARGVLGLDLAGDEANFPIEPHVDAYAFAREAGIRRTAHAGEALGPDSVIQTLTRLQPDRIGHGVRSIESEEAVAAVRAAGVHLEVCPSSNVQVGVVPNYQDHPIERLRQARLSIGVNTDTRTVLNTSLSQEYARMHKVFGWDEDLFRSVNLAAVEAAFVGEEVKASVRARVSGGRPSL
jgi:adenosine deaminase